MQRYMVLLKEMMLYGEKKVKYIMKNYTAVRLEMFSTFMVCQSWVRILYGKILMLIPQFF